MREDTPEKWRGFPLFSAVTTLDKKRHGHPTEQPYALRIAYAGQVDLRHVGPGALSGVRDRESRRLDVSDTIYTAHREVRVREARIAQAVAKGGERLDARLRGLLRR